MSDGLTEDVLKFFFKTFMLKIQDFFNTFFTILYKVCITVTLTLRLTNSILALKAIFNISCRTDRTGVTNDSLGFVH